MTWTFPRVRRPKTAPVWAAYARAHDFVELDKLRLNVPGGYNQWWALQTEILWTLLPLLLGRTARNLPSKGTGGSDSCDSPAADTS